MFSVRLSASSAMSSALRWRRTRGDEAKADDARAGDAPRAEREDTRAEREDTRAEGEDTFASVVNRRIKDACVLEEDAEELRRAYGLPGRGAVEASWREARRNVREMLVYSLFVSLFTFATLFGRNDQQLFRWTEAVREQLVGVEFPAYAAHVDKTFDDIATVEEFWQWMLGPGYNALYTATTFDGDGSYPGYRDVLAGTDGEGAAGPAPDRRQNWPGHVLGMGVRLGGVRLGQIRSDESECAAAGGHPGIVFEGDASSTLRCFERAGDRDRARDGRVPPPGYPAPIAGLQAATEDDEPPFTSSVTSQRYGRPTSYVTLPHSDPGAAPLASEAAASESAVVAALRRLRDAKFIDLHTRAVLVDAALYNPALDYVMVVRLAAELPVAGGVVPSHKFETLRLHRYYTVADHLRLAVEIMLFAMVCGYTWVELRHISEVGLWKYARLDALPHVLNLSLFFVSYSLLLAAWSNLPAAAPLAADDFVDLRSSAFYLELAQDCNAFNAFLTWTKVVKYLAFVPRFKILIGTLKVSAAKVNGFVVICAVVLFGSAQSFTLAFGTHLEGFRNLTQSFFTLVRLLLGDFQFELLREASPFLGPLLFFLFVMLAVFVLLNMFIAIIGDAFEETKKLLESEDAVHGKLVTKALARMLYALPLLGAPLEAAFGAATAEVSQRVQRAVRNRDVHALLGLADDLEAGDVKPGEVMTHLGARGHGSVSILAVTSALVKFGMKRADARLYAQELDVNKNGRIETTELEAMLLGTEDAAAWSSTRRLDVVRRSLGPAGLDERAPAGELNSVVETSRSEGANGGKAPGEAQAVGGGAAAAAGAAASDVGPDDSDRPQNADRGSGGGNHVRIALDELDGVDGGPAQPPTPREVPHVHLTMEALLRMPDGSDDGQAQPLADVETGSPAESPSVQGVADTAPATGPSSRAGTGGGAPRARRASAAASRARQKLRRTIRTHRALAAFHVRQCTMADIRLKMLAKRFKEEAEQIKAASDPVAMATAVLRLQQQQDTMLKQQGELVRKVEELLLQHSDRAGEGTPSASGVHDAT